MKLFGKIPVTMSLSFWVVGGLIGYFNTGSLIGTLIWIAVIFISVLVHEIGHALAACKIGLNPRIELIAFGGLTHYAGQGLSIGRQFFVVVMGPLFGFLLYIAALLLSKFIGATNTILVQSLGLLQMVNLFWTVANLIPVLPLDGGQMLRLGLEAFNKSRGRCYALLVSFVFAFALSIVFFFNQMLLFGAFFFMFAYQNYMEWKNEKETIPHQGTANLKEQFSEAEKALHIGKKEEAIDGFRSILASAPEGGLASVSAQYLAFSEYEQGEKEKAYELLLPRKKTLSKEGLYLLHKIAFEIEKYSLVAEISGPCFQAVPLIDVSERAAKSHAKLGQVEACLGWLETAMELGAHRTQDLISDEIFSEIRQVPAFTKWVKVHLT
jgi:stage IV sporulation protein FB